MPGEAPYRDEGHAALSVADALRRDNADLVEEVRLLCQRIAQLEAGPPKAPPSAARTIVRGLLALVTALGGFVVVDNVWLNPPNRGWELRSTRTSLMELRRAAETWRSMQQDPHACPTPEGLVRDKQIDSASKLTDGWDHPYAIRCDESETTTMSAGPDGMMGTYDDVMVPALVCP